MKVKFRFLYFFVIFRYIIPNGIILLSILNDGKGHGEFASVYIIISNIDIVLLYLAQSVLYFIGVLYIEKTENTKYYFIKKNMFEVDSRKLDVLVFVLILINTGYYYFTGIGKAGSLITTRFSFIFNFISVDPFFMIYYVIGRDKNKKLYVFNVLIYLLLSLTKGWTGQIFFVLSFELYLFFRKPRNVLFGFFMPLCYILGGITYAYLYPIKMYFRIGVWEALNFSEAFEKVIERFSVLPASIVGIQNSDIINFQYHFYQYSHTELYAVLRPSIPSFLMPDKSFRSINNLLMYSVYPGIESTTSSNMGLMSYIYNLVGISKFDALIYAIIIVLIIYIYRLLFTKFWTRNNSGGLNILLFFTILSYIDNGSIETSFYGFLGIVYFIILLIFLKIITIKRIV